jgi:hypothetical protein
MRILVHRAVVGGVETYLQAMLPLLRGHGHEVALLTAYAGGEGRAALDDLCPEVESCVAADPAAALAAAEAWRPDVVYAHGLPDPRAHTHGVLWHRAACAGLLLAELGSAGGV